MKRQCRRFMPCKDLNGGGKMGKPTGFLEFDRVRNDSVEPAERIKNFSEFHPPLAKSRKTKAGGALYELRRSVLPVG